MQKKKVKYSTQLNGRGQHYAEGLPTGGCRFRLKRIVIGARVCHDWAWVVRRETELGTAIRNISWSAIHDGYRKTRLCKGDNIFGYPRTVAHDSLWPRK